MHLLLLLTFGMAVTGKFLEVSKKHTSKVYFDSSPFLFSGEQNQFLSLPESPSIVSNGSFPIDIAVPAPLKHYIWELNGYYLAQETGNHFFFIDDTEIATIQLGWKLPFSRGRQNQIVENEYVFSKWPRAYKLRKGTHYPVKISYIGGPDFVPIYSRLNDKKQEISKEIYTAGGVPFGLVPLRGDYKKTGFSYKVFPAPRGSRYKRLLKEQRDSAPLAEGLFAKNYVKVSPELRDSPYILEILGHFSPPKDGKYTVKLDDQVFSSVQIGPGFKQKKTKYTMNSKWNIFDIRLVSSPPFIELQKKMHYPFRIVILDKKQISSWNTVAVDFWNNEVDLFRLWEAPDLSEKTNTTEPKQGPVLEAPPRKTSDDSVGGSSGAISPDSITSEVISSKDPAANTGHQIPGAPFLILDPDYEGLEGPFQADEDEDENDELDEDENDELDFNSEFQSLAPVVDEVGYFADTDSGKEPEILEQPRTEEMSPDSETPLSSPPEQLFPDIQVLKENHSDNKIPEISIPESFGDFEDDFQLNDLIEFDDVSHMTNPEEPKLVLNELSKALDPTPVSSLEIISPVKSVYESFLTEKPSTVETPVSPLLNPGESSSIVSISLKPGSVTAGLSKKRPKTVKLKKFHLDFDEDFDVASKVGVQSSECLIDSNCEQFLPISSESNLSNVKTHVKTHVKTPVVALANTFESPSLVASNKEMGISCLKLSCDEREPTSTETFISDSQSLSNKLSLPSVMKENSTQEGVLNRYDTQEENETGLFHSAFAKKVQASSFLNKSTDDDFSKASGVQQLEILSEEVVIESPKYSGKISKSKDNLEIHSSEKTSKNFSAYQGSGSVQKGNSLIFFCFSISIMLLVPGL